MESATTYSGRTKYHESAARDYQVRKKGKHLAEMRMVDRAFRSIPKTHRVLDIPCGGGRVTIHLAKKGYNVCAADLSDAMLEIAQEKIASENLRCTVQKQDVEKLTFADRSFDSVVNFRLFHHFPNPEIRQKAVSELCRVARKYVAISYFSPLSFTSAKRKLLALTSRKPSDKYSTSLSEVKKYFSKANFRLVTDVAQLAMIHTMHLAIFERIGEMIP